jgi:hypothetical protein
MGGKSETVTNGGLRRLEECHMLPRLRQVRQVKKVYARVLYTLCA